MRPKGQHPSPGMGQVKSQRPFGEVAGLGPERAALAAVQVGAAQPTNRKTHSESGVGSLDESLGGKLVGAREFEPPTPDSRSRWAAPRDYFPGYERANLETGCGNAQLAAKPRCRKIPACRLRIPVKVGQRF